MISQSEVRKPKLESLDRIRHHIFWARTWKCEAKNQLQVLQIIRILTMQTKTHGTTLNQTQSWRSTTVQINGAQKMLRILLLVFLVFGCTKSKQLNKNEEIILQMLIEKNGVTHSVLFEVELGAICNNIYLFNIQIGLIAIKKEKPNLYLLNSDLYSDFIPTVQIGDRILFDTDNVKLKVNERIQKILLKNGYQNGLQLKKKLTYYYNDPAFKFKSKH